MKAYLRALRLERWPRSTAIFVGSIACIWFNLDYLKLYSWQIIIFNMVFAFLLTWGISTLNYIINEIADAPYDIHHPIKKNRPLARGEVKKNTLILIGIILGSVSLGFGFYYFSLYFFLFLTILLFAGLVYNVKPMRVKEIPFLDAIVESANNPIRFFIGWYALTKSNKFPPASLFLLWWAFGNFLMVAKRLSERRLLKDKAGDYRLSLKKYTEKSLLVFMIISVIIFFVLYFIFALTYKLQSFLYFSPFILLYFYLFFKKTIKEKGIMEEPEQLFMNLKFGSYTFFLLILIIISILFDKIGE
ncbi:UbiA family prenyltransferase [Candidatus Aminicenantes bacterium AH-873-B07]|jgi:4-hydroxybenzoate polyprenyltransferase|nr:UbiA family prenyltransferase [Candidatus Aminicenantes bacterium AH-873-B07]